MLYLRPCLLLIVSYVIIIRYPPYWKFQLLQISVFIPILQQHKVRPFTSIYISTHRNNTVFYRSVRKLGSASVMLHQPLIRVCIRRKRSAKPMKTLPGKKIKKAKKKNAFCFFNFFLNKNW